MIGPIAAEEVLRLVEGDLADPEVPGGRAWIFDLRAEEAFLAGHLPRAIHLPEAQLARRPHQSAQAAELVVLVDEDGAARGAAHEAAAELAHKWFRRVGVLAGGFAAWRAAGLPVAVGGPAGDGAAAADGTREEFKASRAVPWKAGDPAVAGRP